MSEPTRPDARALLDQIDAHISKLELHAQGKLDHAAALKNIKASVCWEGRWVPVSDVKLADQQPYLVRRPKSRVALAMWTGRWITLWGHIPLQGIEIEVLVPVIISTEQDKKSEEDE